LDEIKRLLAAMACCGAAPLDIKLGNIMRGHRSGRLYCLDFETARLSSQPGWAETVEDQYRLLDPLTKAKAVDVNA
jgi:hypothetical protein